MHITELEIDNFKSFSKKTKIPFLEGFSVISGPNGSGKSNIIDSILFVLALSSSRNLRAEKLTDLINLNSGRNTAEVALEFSDGTKIRRRIKRTGNGYYSYNYLNERLCKQSDIVDHLAKHGIKPHGYNVVMQGDVTRIMEMSDFERRKIIDEIAGVSEFDTKKQQSLAELEIVRERIEREELLLIELTKRTNELKREREHALEYQKWQKELAYFQNCRSAAQLHEREKELKNLLRSTEDNRIQLTRIASDRGLEENELSYLKADLKDIDDLINKKSGSDYLKLIAELEEAKSGIKLADQSILRLRKEKEGNLEVMNRVYMDTKRAEARVAECTDQIRTLTIDRTNIAMEIATSRAQLERFETEIRQHSEDTDGARTQLFGLIKEAEEKKAERSGILHQQDMLIEKSRMRTTELERLTALLRQLDEEYTAKQGQLNDSGKSVADLTAEKKELDRHLSELEGMLFAQRSTLERLRTEIRSCEQDTIRLEAAQQARGESGGKALEAILAMKGVHGTISDLGKAPAEYSIALNVAAGNKLHFVVCDDDQVAADAIRYLKEERLGRATFLPLNKLKPPALSPLKEPGVIDYAVNLLEYDPKFDRAFAVALGGTVVVDTLERARKLIGKYRMVTLDGELLEKSGAITGGMAKKQAGRGFGAAVDDEIYRLRMHLVELQSEASTLESGVKRLTEEGDAKRQTRNEIDQKIARFGMFSEEFSRRFEAITVEKQTIEAAVTRQSEETRNGAEELVALETHLDRKTEEIAAINNRLDAIKKRLDDTNIPALTEQIEKKRREIEEAERRLRNKEADINDAQRERQHFTSRTGELAEERSRQEERNQQIDAEITASQVQITAYKSQMAALEERQKEFSGELDELRGKRGEVMQHIQESELKVMKFDADRERISVTMTAIEERARTLQIEVDMLKHQIGELDTTLTLSEIEVKIAEADGALRKIGAVNMLAIDEYEKVQRQVGERTDRKETLSSERATLIERIEKFEQMKYEAFATAFKAINSNFREIFARLTSGSGHLILENEEDPFAGGMTFAVQPRDKKVHLLSSLSGGEKSLTTLAFIFSIQRYIPAPFYAFDEVDMSLDGSNVERIASMIKELAPTSQFVIVSLRKPMIDAAERIMGVTLRSDKSTLVTGGKGTWLSLGAGENDPVTDISGTGDLKKPGPGNGLSEVPAAPLAGDESVTSPGTNGASGFQIQAAVEDPVEILVGLAERGEIDPWNIDIIEVTDRFLSELERRRELNLQLSGRTLFYAATLLRMKSEQLEVAEPEEEDAGEDDLFGSEFAGGTGDEIDYGGRLGPIERLEHEIQRRLDRKNLRKSPITLFELITDLKNIEKEERRRRRMAADPGDSFLIDADDVVSIAHEEGFQETSLTRLAEYLEGLELEEEVTLAELCERMEWGIPEVFIPLLFLALEGRCTLRQEEFFGDIWVQICRAGVGKIADGTPAE